MVDGMVIFIKHGRLYITTSTRMLKAKVYDKFSEELDKLDSEITPKCPDKSAPEASIKAVVESSDEEGKNREDNSTGVIDDAQQVIVNNEVVTEYRLESRVKSTWSKYPKLKDKTSCLSGEGDEAQ